MKSPSPTRLQQIQVPINGDHYEPVTSSSASKSEFAPDHDTLQSRLLQLCPAKLWYNKSYSAFCPHPILIASIHQRRLKDLHTALDLAISDIVSRWWTDSEAQFPRRMPLDPKEEALLQVWSPMCNYVAPLTKLDPCQWVDKQCTDTLPAFHERRGSWRPDFLVEQDVDGQENFRITEINARFVFNGSMYVAYGQEALQGVGVTSGRTRLVGATSREQVGPEPLSGGSLSAQM
ncbi:hypothetical protein ATERTT37_003944 [Aspergillus terreus]